MNGIYDTELLRDRVGRVEDVEELKAQVLPQLREQRILWMEQIEGMIRASGKSCREFAKDCGISEAALRKWRKDGALPRNREAFIRVGFAAGLDLEEMNSFLRRYGRCPQLYVKSLEDSACIYVLSSRTLPHDYATYRELVGRMEQVLRESDSPAGTAVSTERMERQLDQVDDSDALMAFVRDHAASYKAAYLKLYAHILQFLRSNRLDDRLGSGDKLRTIGALSQEQDWSSSLRHCISEIRSKRWYPTRSKLISLGLHLNMELEDVNRMLTLAQMDTLYVKNPAEAALIFALESAELEMGICCDGEPELRDYARRILTEVNLEDADFLLDRL